MKTLEKQRQAEYLLLHTIIGCYLNQCFGGTAKIPRYLETETVSDIIMPFSQLKLLIQRIEWLEDDVYIDELMAFMSEYEMTFEELQWAIDMFALQKQTVQKKIEDRINDDE